VRDKLLIDVVEDVIGEIVAARGVKRADIRRHHDPHGAAADRLLGGDRARESKGRNKRDES